LILLAQPGYNSAEILDQEPHGETVNLLHEAGPQTFT